MIVGGSAEDALPFVLARKMIVEMLNWLHCVSSCVIQLSGLLCQTPQLLDVV
jgi:hypothetical protein